MQKKNNSKKKKVSKFKSIYYIIRSNNASRTTTFTTQTKISISLESLVNNNLKRKLKQSTNINRILSVDATQENIITNYLIKKLKSNKLLILLFELISILIENSINKTNVSQIFNKIQTKVEEKL